MIKIIKSMSIYHSIYKIILILITMLMVSDSEMHKAMIKNQIITKIYHPVVHQHNNTRKMLFIVNKKNL